MGRLPVLSGGDAVRIFIKAGWSVDRQRGSHVILVKRKGIRPPFPFPITRNWRREHSAACFAPRA